MIVVANENENDFSDTDGRLCADDCDGGWRLMRLVSGFRCAVDTDLSTDSTDSTGATRSYYVASYVVE